MKVFRRNAKMRVAPGSSVDPAVELRAALAAARERLAEFDSAMESLQRRHDSMLASNTMLRRQNESLRVEKAEVLGRLSAADHRIVELGAANADLTFDLEQAREEARRAEAHVAELLTTLRERAKQAGGGTGGGPAEPILP